MDFGLLPCKRKSAESNLYELLVPNGSQSSYNELLFKLDFIKDLIEYTENFAANYPKIHKRDDFEIRYCKALISLKVANDAEGHINSYQSPADTFIEIGNNVLTYSNIQDFLHGANTSDRLLHIYIEFLAPIDRVLIVTWESLLEIVQKGNYLEGYLSALIYIEHKNTIVLINRVEKIMTKFVKIGTECNDEEEMICERFGCARFAKIERIHEWTNDDFLAIIRKFYKSGTVDEDVTIPANFQSMILHDLYAM